MLFSGRLELRHRYVVKSVCCISVSHLPCAAYASAIRFRYESYGLLLIIRFTQSSLVNRTPLAASSLSYVTCIAIVAAALGLLLLMNSDDDDDQ